MADKPNKDVIYFIEDSKPFYSSNPFQGNTSSTREGTLVSVIRLDKGEKITYDTLKNALIKAKSDSERQTAAKTFSDFVAQRRVSDFVTSRDLPKGRKELTEQEFQRIAPEHLWQQGKSQPTIAMK